MSWTFAVRLLMSGNQFPIRLTIDFKTSKPWALKKLLKHVRVKYKNPAVMIHENGNLARILSRISLTRNEQHFAADAHHMKSIESYCAFFLFISGAADRPDPSGGNSYDDEFRSQFLQDYIEATLQSIRYQYYSVNSAFEVLALLKFSSRLCQAAGEFWKWWHPCSEI